MTKLRRARHAALAAATLVVALCSVAPPAPRVASSATSATQALRLSRPNGPGAQFSSGLVPLPLTPLPYQCVEDSQYGAQLVYAHAADVPDSYVTRSAQLLSMFQQSDAQLDAEAQHFGLHQQFYVLCAGGSPSVADLRLPTTLAGSSMWSIIFDMQAQGYTSRLRKYWILFDGNVGNGLSGQATFHGMDWDDAQNPSNQGPDYAIDYGINNYTAMMHEVAHTLGAVQNSAPHSTGADHCWDGNDIMCYNDGGPNGGLSSTTACPTGIHFDCNWDDYYNPLPPPGNYLFDHWDMGKSYDNFVTPVDTSVGGVVMDGWGGLHPFGHRTVSLAGSPYWPGWDIARGVAMLAGGGGGYVLDGWGGVHPFGSAPAAASSAYWPGWDIARGLALRPQGGGWVLDGWGGVHSFGGAPTAVVSGFWPGWDIARAIVAAPDGNGGYVLDGWGGIHPFGAEPVLAGTGYWPGWDIARGIVLLPSGQGGYVLDGYGGLHVIGTAPAPIGGEYWSGQDIARSLTTLASGGGYVFDAYGGVHAYGGAMAVSSTGYWSGWRIARGGSAG